ncbi:sterol-binding domain protein [Dinoroseobacter shibae DFL 12 = DSM 16493]|jgi:putative sterol carrier protein|uniref:Sterol-binding domain protein n=1 Tax=Dinoroseobacter shibae (strain DSM 16493 / NCIMB 14021 / DFL 12) TaxID=398580 RepID=A8LQY3_DINSH|nr:SCP2 sterol-binding domain-containing protein [Dinoroseobacter shibae]ABV92526.1 sterol-binding domain protein [Dinoroseobacter shibae DFL 12 = DSM 16493]URF47469.1 SCP2 sterol-binding domain-containing protein [Dinoroseobacter shibae]URF51780.1 SCP2 sterol-binding domain-containing protein [Dinoroseobacter shibae]
MSEVIEKAVEALQQRLPDGFDGTVKFVIEDEGAVMVDENGVRAGDEDAECILTASSDTFQGIMSGDVNPTAAFMTGKLKLDGDMGMAMKLGSALS